MDNKKTALQRLLEVQKTLKAPKNQTNKFGGYKYRSCEDILEALKQPLHDNSLTIVVSDEITEIAGRVYVKATVNLYDTLSDFKISSHALAREAENKKGMDESQITGAASSYARKYALNGMFCIDDTKDADSINDHGKSHNGTNKYSNNKKESVNNEREIEKYRDPLAYAYKKGALTSEESDYMKKIGPKKDLEEYKKAHSTILKRIFEELPDEKKGPGAEAVAKEDLRSLIDM